MPGGFTSVSGISGAAAISWSAGVNGIFGVTGIPDCSSAPGIPVCRRALPYGIVRPCGHGFCGCRGRRQKEQEPCQESCYPSSWFIVHRPQSRYFDRTSYEILCECKACGRKNSPAAFPCGPCDAFPWTSGYVFHPRNYSFLDMSRFVFTFVPNQYPLR